MSTAPGLANQRTGEAQAGSRSGGRRSPRVRYRPEGGGHPERLVVHRLLRILPLADMAVAVVILLGGFLASNIDSMPAGLHGFLQIRLTIQNLLLVFCYCLAWRLICASLGLYDERRIANRAAEAARVVGAVSLGSAVALVFPLISVTRAFDILAILYYWIGTATSMLAIRAGLRSLLRTRAHTTHDVVIVGSGPRALSLYQALFAERPDGYRCVGFVDYADQELPALVREKLLGDFSALEEILMRQAVDEVIIALPVRSRYAEIQRTIEICERGGVAARYLADVFQHRRSGEPWSGIGPLASIPAGVSPDDGRLVVKRGLDLGLGGLALVAAAPILAMAVLAIKLTSPGPLLFAQERYGLNKRRFMMYKLRTMVAGAEAQQALLETQNEASGPVFKIRDDPRITPVGRLLRRLSIDELPQLVNVLRGEMSLVGPRPLPMRDVALFSEPALMRRFSVYPGVTGLWQVSGRSEVAFDDWIKLDLQYIDEWSLGLDLRILARTVPAVLNGRGAV